MKSDRSESASQIPSTSMSVMIGRPSAVFLTRKAAQIGSWFVPASQIDDHGIHDNIVWRTRDRTGNLQRLAGVFSKSQLINSDRIVREGSVKCLEIGGRRAVCVLAKCKHSDAVKVGQRQQKVTELRAALFTGERRVV